MVDTKNKWNYLYQEPILTGDSIVSGHCGTLSFSISVDTMIEGTLYKKVKCERIKYNGTDTSYVGAIREDSINQKVFFRWLGWEEKLLYAFNVKVGELISMDSTSFKDAILKRSVMSIGQYDFSGFGGKKITVVDSIIRLNSPLMSSETRTVDLYEGIGSFRNIFDLYSYSYPTFDISDFLCFSHNDSLIVKNPLMMTCIYTSFPQGLEQTVYNSGLRIFPNPVESELSIESNREIKGIEFYDLSGQIKMQSSKLILDLTKFKTGIYLLNIIYKDGQKSTCKITKK